MPTYRRIPKGAIKVPLPDTRQVENYSCGASALQAVCAYYGIGREEEYEYIEDMKLPKDGADPHHIVRVAEKYGLKCKANQPMTVKQLRTFLNQGRPVLLMLQAWCDEEDLRVNYREIWNEGHWVVAIGYDKKGVYFEDPSLAAIRGYLSYKDLEGRWHDVGPEDVHVPHYGLAVWKRRTSRPAYFRRARVLE